MQGFRGKNIKGLFQFALQEPTLECQLFANQGHSPTACLIERCTNKSSLWLESQERPSPYVFCECRVFV